MPPWTQHKKRRANPPADETILGKIGSAFEGDETSLIAKSTLLGSLLSGIGLGKLGGLLTKLSTMETTMVSLTGKPRIFDAVHKMIMSTDAELKKHVNLTPDGMKNTLNKALDTIKDTTANITNSDAMQGILGKGGELLDRVPDHIKEPLKKFRTQLTTRPSAQSDGTSPAVTPVVKEKAPPHL